MSLMVCLLDGTYGRRIANLLFDQTRQWCICHARRVAHCVLVAQLTDRHTAFALAQNCKNLEVAISRHLHQNLLRYPAKKISLPHPLSFRGDYLSNGNESKKVHEAGKGWLTTHPQSIHFVLFCWVKSIEIFSLFFTHLHSLQVKPFQLIYRCSCIARLFVVRIFGTISYLNAENI